jgi:hypothetical protein
VTDCVGLQSYRGQYNVTQLQREAIDAEPLGGRSRLYQLCTELGSFASVDRPASPYVNATVSYQWLVQACGDVFQTPLMQPDTDALNAKFGGRKIVTMVSNVLFSVCTISVSLSRFVPCSLTCTAPEDRQS